MSEPITPVTSPAIREPHYERVGLAGLGASGGVLAINSMAEAVSVAQLMAKSGIAIRKHLRDQPGACLGVLMQALRWEMDPYMVGNKSYAVNDQLAYEAQLIAAVVLTRAAIVDEPDYDYAGEDATRTCTVTFKMRSGKRLSYTTPEIGKIKTQNSPLWKSDPDQQLGYFAVRSWARRHQPHVLLGVYTPEEASEIIDVTPGTSGVASRLPGAQNGDGFNSDSVHAETERAAPKAGRARKPRSPERAPEETVAATAPDETPAAQGGEGAPAAEEPQPDAPGPETQTAAQAAAAALEGDDLPEALKEPQQAINESLSAHIEAMDGSGRLNVEEEPEVEAEPEIEGGEEEEALPPEFATFADAVEDAETFVEVKAALQVFFTTETFRALSLPEQNHVRLNTWQTIMDKKAEGHMADLPDHATDVSAFRLWTEWCIDPEAITGTLAVLEQQPSFAQKEEPFKQGIRAAVAARIERLKGG